MEQPILVCGKWSFYRNSWFFLVDKSKGGRVVGVGRKTSFTQLMRMVDYWKAHRTLKFARRLVSGSFEIGYQDLPIYLYMIRRANPGTLTKLEIDGKDRFKYLFIAFSAIIHGFRYIRKVVVVDEIFLQGKYRCSEEGGGGIPSLGFQSDICSDSRYNFTTSNIAESMNQVLSHARGYPIVQLVDAARSMSTRWFAARKRNASLMKTLLTTGVEKLLESRVDNSKLWTAQEIDNDQIQVTCGGIFQYNGEKVYMPEI
ncbi:unnamed protein product [Microthlaspi erraticum]|uniref:Uncharacterized protein n=1 Tax=Microthlaspi erraticum TaxID=1685480 RepID=A0A6D2JTC9_9BRAS|nr:unnamed protein product [Microthlaspi erraticum]